MGIIIMEVEMKLELFQFVEESIEYISKISYILDTSTSDIAMFFNSIFSEEDYFLNINSRVKSPNSIKEKLLKNNTYAQSRNVEDLILKISDLIGVRIECRFISDEEKVFMKLLSIFDVKLEGGYYGTSLNDKISIKLDEKQPQFQKNGFEIYKIDGRYTTKDSCFNFELQIKSLVNNFWGDIEHRILYKNYNYLMSEQFIKDMMGSIKDNLSLIDRQLRVVYNHVNSMEINTTQKSMDQIKNVLSKIIYDIYTMKVREQLGFVVDFRGIIELIIDYTFIFSSYSTSSEFGIDFIKILNRLKSLESVEGNFDEYIEFERELVFKNQYEYALGNRLKAMMNSDFKWHLFFKIVFDIEEEENEKDFEKFIRYLTDKFENMINNSMEGLAFTEGHEEEIKDFIMGCIVECFCKQTDIEFLDNYNLQTLETHIKAYLRGMSSYSDWIKNSDRVRATIINYKKK